MKTREKKGSAPGSESLESELAAAFEWIARAAIDAGVDAGGFLKAARIGLARAGNRAVLNRSLNGAASTSRIAALTGLTRKEIPDLLANDSRVAVPRTTPLRSLVKEWTESAEFLDGSGKPRAISIEGQSKSLKSLVAKVAADIPHVSVLKELETSGLVSRQGSDKIRLSSKAQSILNRKEKDLEKLARRIKRISRSAYAEISEPQERMINEEAVLQCVPRNLVGLFLKDFRERSQALLGAVTKWESAHKNDTKAVGSGERIGLGVYLIREDSLQPFETISSSNPQPPTRRAKRA